MATIETNRDIQEELANALPSRIQKAKRGIGSFVTIDAGSVYLWVYLCDWVLRANGSEVLSSEEQDDDVFGEALIPLTGVDISSITMKGQDSIVISFNQGWELFIYANSNEHEGSDELIIIYFDDSAPLAYSLEKGWCRGS